MIRGPIKKIIPRFAIGWYHFSLAFFGALFYGFSSRAIKVVGIIGTNGKTTTVNLTAAILEEAGFKVAVASSIKFKIGQEEKENKLKMTMPGRAVLQKFLRDAVKAKCDYAVVECTSEGVLQYRHKFIRFDVMVFTNLSAEHIERHKGFENYKKAKAEYFKTCKGIHIINTDDENAEHFLGFAAKEKYFYKVKSQKSKVNNTNQNSKIIEAEDVKEKDNSISFAIQNLLFTVPLIGRFNVYNSLAAICAGLSQGISLKICQRALEKVKQMPGRMEEVMNVPFRVIVDYAFTPNALEQVYATLTSNFKSQIANLNIKSQNFQENSKPKLICVLGACGGGRDKWKRPVLGQIAAKYCDEIIITNEDPYDEPPLDIINHVALGAEGVKLLLKCCFLKKEFNSFRVSFQVLKILDRREAIGKALSLANLGDTVVITGKGCEPWICVANNKKIPWDDRQIVREEFQKIPKKN